MQFVYPTYEITPLHQQNILSLINSIKNNNKINDSMKKNIASILIAHGYYLVVDVHKKGLIDLFSSTYKIFLLTILVEIMTEIKTSMEDKYVFSLTDFVYNLNELDESTRLKIIQNIKKSDITNKIDKIVSMLREIYDIYVPHDSITNAYSRYSREKIDSYYLHVYPRTETIHDYIRDALEKI
jgi:hypothetical protein